MLDRETRTAVLKLQQAGHALRSISKILGISRNAVRRILKSGTPTVRVRTIMPEHDVHLPRIRALMVDCRGNRVRVQEELAREGVVLSYQTLTRLMRQHQIGVTQKIPAGRYHFDPGQEMQHDTSTIRYLVGGTMRRIECASLVLAYSRRIFAQCSFRFDRFQCRCFLAKALKYYGASARRCMVDNTSCIVASGSGRRAIIAAEMVALGECYGFVFVAHEVGDANRSARVERPFDFIQQNFFAGRTFESLEDLNAQLLAWCQQVDQRFHRELQQTRMELFAAERSALQTLPAFVAEPRRVRVCVVDVEGYVVLETNRYSVDVKQLGHTVQAHETENEVALYQEHVLLCTHQRLPAGARHRSTLPEHERQRRWRHMPKHTRPTSPEEDTLRQAIPALTPLIEAIQKKAGHQAVREIRRLHRMWLEYPSESLLRAIDIAMAHGLLDVSRIEKCVLRELADVYFRLPGDPPP